VESALVCVWCKLGNDHGHFRVDRIVVGERMDQRYSVPSGSLFGNSSERFLRQLRARNASFAKGVNNQRIDPEDGKFRLDLIAVRGGAGKTLPAQRIG
jgi:hypothetical protein